MSPSSKRGTHNATLLKMTRVQFLTTNAQEKDTLQQAMEPRAEKKKK